MLVSYSHMSVCDGYLSRFEFRKGLYRWMKDDYAINECPVGNTPKPRSLARAKRLCANYGW